MVERCRRGFLFAISIDGGSLSLACDVFKEPVFNVSENKVSEKTGACAKVYPVLYRREALRVKDLPERVAFGLASCKSFRFLLIYLKFRLLKGAEFP